MLERATEMATWRAVYRVAHGLRYRVLPELIGQRLTIGSLDTAEASLRRLASRWVADDAVLRHPQYIEGTLAKYGLIDAEFEASKRLLEHRDVIVGLEAMRECGFLPRRGDRWAPDETACGAGFAHEIAEDLAADGCVVKLMLRDEIPGERHAQMLCAQLNERGWSGELRLPGTYLPRELTVIDACATNAGFVWFFRHLYL